MIRMLAPRVRSRLEARLPQNPSRLLVGNLVSRRAVDGAVLNGLVPRNAFAKYALRKGLPVPGQKTMAIENEPHTVDDFDGVIKEGYGAGVKKLLSSEQVVVKIKGQTFHSKMNYHQHQAKRAGLHYDLVVEGVPPGCPKWELNVPRGPFKGRYAFNRTEKGMIVVPMRDNGVLHPKPDYTLRDREFLSQIDAQSKPLHMSSTAGVESIVQRTELRTGSPVQRSYILERKYDGSLGNARVDSFYKAFFRSHRPTGETYYDRLPALEFLHNRSPLFVYRILVPGPGITNSEFKGELVHMDGAARTSGILNSLPINAHRIQKLRGPVEYYVWDIIKYKGRDVSHWPYAKRRALCEVAVAEVRRFNPAWHIAERQRPGETALEFYDRVTHDPLPFGEGVVIKAADQVEAKWPKIKQTGFGYFTLKDMLPGQGKYKDTVGCLVVQNPENGAVGEIGSFSVPDEYRDWMYSHREELQGSTIKVRVQEVTSRGAPRAGVFLGFHNSESEAGLLMYSESLAGGDPKAAKEVKYKLISAAGWRQ